MGQGADPVALRLRRRLERQRLIARAIRRRRALRTVSNRTERIAPGDILCCVTLRDERARLPYLLDYYRAMGVRHFLMVDDASTDGSGACLRGQPSVSLWWTNHGYKAARFGMDWINSLLLRHGRGHWCLTVDSDEFLVYPHTDQRPLPALTGWLEAMGRRSFPAMLLDMYPQGPVEDAVCPEGPEPFRIARWFDPANYSICKNAYFGNL